MELEKGEAIMVGRLPECDFCGNQAEYDAKTIYGPWATMCEACWTRKAQSKLLGMGKGQRLVLARDL